MTIMRVSLAEIALSESQKAQMASRLIDAFSLIEVGRAAPEVKKGFLVLFEALGRTDLWMGDHPMVDATQSGKAAVVTAQVMAGPWTPGMKSELFASVETIVREIADMPRETGGMNFWMTIVEVPEGAWGVDGRPVSIGSLAPVFADDQKQRIVQHLDDLSARSNE